MKIILLITFILLLALLIVWILGPRYILTEIPSNIPSIPDNIEEYLSKSESKIPNLKQGIQKEIIWANTNKQQTDYAIVYLHGFSSSKKELSPVMEETAKLLNANLYFTRFTGHGSQSGELLLNVNEKSWMEDTLEAIAIGNKIGKKIILAGTSQGGLLACWAASLDEIESLAALIMISPNFGPQDKRTKLITTPWAKQVLPLLFGKHRHWTAQNSAHEYYWNTRYPSHSLFPMMAQVNYITPRCPFLINTPTLVFYSQEDQTVLPENIIKAFEEIPTKHKELVEISNSTDKDRHIIAGDILSPNTTVIMIEKIKTFIQSL